MVNAYQVYRDTGTAKDPFFGLSTGSGSQSLDDVFKWFFVEAESSSNPKVLLVNGLPSQEVITDRYCKTLSAPRETGIGSPVLLQRTLSTFPLGFHTLVCLRVSSFIGVIQLQKIGFNGTLLIGPKPHQPTKHQYDWDVATMFAFLQKYALTGEFKINVECNHATLSGHSCHHELETARINGLLGNIDANTGDPQVAWDTDRFMADIAEPTLVTSSVVKNGGLVPGGSNFDAKLRRESTDVENMFLAHISGVDILAHGLRSVAKLIEDDSLDDLVRKRYQSFDSETGALIEAGKGDFETLEKNVLE